MAYPHAHPRALLSVVVVGSVLGAGLAFAYGAGANSTSGLTHLRARQMDSAEGQGFSDAALQQAAGLPPGALAIARRHDPFNVSGAPQRDRQSADFAARFDSAGSAAGGVAAVGLILRPDLGPEGETVGRRLAFALNGARDLDCLTQAVYYEARGESPKGQAAVAQVVLNRVRHPAFPKTICSVVFQGAGAARSDCQFSFVCDGSMRAARDDEAWDKAQQVAARALSGVVMADVGAATHFHAARLNDQWGEGLVRVAQVGVHVFYRFGRARAPFQAQLLQAAADVVTPRTPAPAQPVPAGPETVKAEILAKPAPVASAEALKPVAAQAPKTESPKV